MSVHAVGIRRDVAQAACCNRRHAATGGFELQIAAVNIGDSSARTAGHLQVCVGAGGQQHLHHPGVPLHHCKLQRCAAICTWATGAGALKSTATAAAPPRAASAAASAAAAAAAAAAAQPAQLATGAPSRARAGPHHPPILPTHTTPPPPHPIVPTIVGAVGGAALLQHLADLSFVALGGGPQKLGGAAQKKRGRVQEPRSVTRPNGRRTARHSNRGLLEARCMG